MKKIVAIGGGEIGRPGFPIETTKIDKEIIRLSGKKKPRLLFIPTASSDSNLFCETVEKHFGKRLGCKIDILHLIKETPGKKEIEKKIMSADIIYVGGGNTQKMIRIWKKTGVDKVLERAYKKGVVLSGLSAGSICWFSAGVSDSRRFTNPKADLIRVNGLGFVNAICTPHYDVERDRRQQLKKIMKKTSGVSIALDNCSAIEIIDKQYRIISSKSKANAYKVYWKKGKYYEKAIKKTKDFRPLKQLLEKTLEI